MTPTETAHAQIANLKSHSKFKDQKLWVKLSLYF